MHLLELNVNWFAFLSAATDMVWLACLVVGAIACALLLGYVAMLGAEMGQRGVLSWSEHMGYGAVAPRHRVGLTGDTPLLRSTRPSMVWVQGLLQKL